MKKLFTLVFATMFGTMLALAQSNPLTQSDVTKILTGVNDANIKSLTYKDDDGKQRYNLASLYTFRNLVKADFSKLTGADNTNTVGQYASLAIDPYTYKLAFTPLAWSSTNEELKMRPFKNIYALNVAATLSNQSVLELKDWRKINVNFSWTRIIKTGYTFAKDDKETLTPTTHEEPYRKLYGELSGEYMTRFARAYKQNGEINRTVDALRSSEFSDGETLQSAYQDSVAYYEQMMVKPNWRKKSFMWLKFTANFLSFDNSEYIVTASPKTLITPIAISSYTPAVNFSLNYYQGIAKKINLYLSGSIQYGIKNTFSGVYTASTFTSYSPLTDSTFLEKPSKQVFKLKNDQIETRLLPDFGFQTILMYSAKKMSFGLDLAYNNAVAISNIEGQRNGNISSPTVGFILGFQNKSGKNSINVEPFFNYIDYINLDVPDQRSFGIKFSVPFNSLF